MYSYKEFSEQVESEMLSFANKNQFSLFEKKEDHCLRYQNSDWEVLFYCEFGSVDLFLINLEDGYRYRLGNILELRFPDSTFTKIKVDYGYGSLPTVKFNIEVLENIYTQIVEDYGRDRSKFLSIAERSSFLIDFVKSRGSQELMNQFDMSNDNWIQLASKEYSRERQMSIYKSNAKNLSFWNRFISKLKGELK